MIFYKFLIFAIICFGGFVIYKVAVNAWKKSSVEDKIDEIELEKEIHDQIEDIKQKDAKSNKEDIDKFLKS